jgi:hypothetical protein
MLHQLYLSSAKEINIRAKVQDWKHPYTNVITPIYTVYIEFDGVHLKIDVESSEEFSELVWKHNIPVEDNRKVKATRCVAEGEQHEMPHL